ncbi:hypothetical protein KAH37_03605, partial [bacterium]|nr:hypothetical protein [bacterium]
MRNRLFLALAVLFAMLLLSSCGDTKSNDTGDGDDSDVTATGPCGNGKIDDNEVCDPKITYECWEAGHYYPDNKAVCKADCSGWDTSACVKRDDADTCGDGKLDDTKELCEMGDTKPCSEIKDTYTSGEATCKRDCRGWDILNCGTAGNKVCSLMFLCAKSCADQACVDSCKENAKEGEDTKVQSLWDCFSSTCPTGDDATEQKCLEEQCGTEYYTCHPDKKCGNGVIDEGETCEKGETKTCIEVGPDTFQDMYDAVCNSLCSGFDTYNCIPKDALACFQLYDCIVECKEDTDCVAACKLKGYRAASEKFDAMEECYVDECGALAPEQTCIDEKCEFQTNACHTHATCGNGNIDAPYEVCEKQEKKDCGAVDPEKYESGTGNAWCDMNCTGWTVGGCYGFCSCT